MAVVGWHFTSKDKRAAYRAQVKDYWDGARKGAAAARRSVRASVFMIKESFDPDAEPEQVARLENAKSFQHIPCEHDPKREAAADAPVNTAEEMDYVPRAASPDAQAACHMAFCGCVAQQEPGDDAPEDLPPPRPTRHLESVADEAEARIAGPAAVEAADAVDVDVADAEEHETLAALPDPLSPGHQPDLADIYGDLGEAKLPTPKNHKKPGKRWSV